MYSIQQWKKLFPLWSSPETVEISHQMLFPSSSRVYSCNRIMFLPSQKYGCHLRPQVQQFYGPSCNVFKTSVASASRLEDFIGAFSSLAWIASNLSSLSTVCVLSAFCIATMLLFSAYSPNLLLWLPWELALAKLICNTAALKTDSIPKLRHTVTSLNTETYIYHQKPDDS